MQWHLRGTSVPAPSRILGYHSWGRPEQLPGNVQIHVRFIVVRRYMEIIPVAESYMDFFPGWGASAHATWLATAGIPR